MNDVAPVAAEDAVVLVLAGNSITLVSALAETMEPAPIIPAPRLLAEVAADGPLVSQLGLATSAAAWARAG